MTYTVSGRMLNPTHSLTVISYYDYKYTCPKHVSLSSYYLSVKY